MKEMVEDVMRQSEAALRSGARAAAEVEELTRRTEEAMDWRKQLSRHPWASLALAAGAVLIVGRIIARD